MKDLTQGKTSKIILQFALPIFIGSLFNLLYNLTDTRIIGSFLGNDALASVGSISTVNDLIVGLLVGLANGFSVITAQFYGMGRKDKIKKNFASSVFAGLIITIIISAVCLIGLPVLLNILNIDEFHKGAAAGYISIIFAGLIFTFLYNVLAATLRAVGDSYTPLIFLVISVIINVLLDLLFVGALELGVEGTAIATVISQIISFISCAIYTWIRHDILRIHLADLKPEKEYLYRILPAGFSMGLMSCLVSFGTVALQTAINNLGTNIIVAHAAARKLTNLYMMPHIALSTAMATFCGQNYGANRLDRVREGLKSVVLMCYVWIFIVQIMTYTICPFLVKAITDSTITEVIDTACLYQRVDTLFYAVVVIISVFRNSLQGLGDHKTPIISSTLELIGKIAFAFIFTPLLGYWAVIWAEPVVWIIMVIPLIISVYKRLYKTSPSTTENENE